MLIGLNGSLKAGKDTTFQVIRELYPEAERISFADSLKFSASQALGMSLDLLEHLKGQEQIHIEIPRMAIMQSSLSSDHKAEASHWKLNIRAFLQRYGTEAHREMFGDDFWVDMALPHDLHHDDKLLIVTDMRFPNEIARVKELGGHTVKVLRDTATSHANHPSEQNLDHLMDHFLDNRGDLSQLQNNVAELLLKLGLPNRVAI